MLELTVSVDAATVVMVTATVRAVSFGAVRETTALYEFPVVRAESLV